MSSNKTPSAPGELAWRVARDCDPGNCVRIAPDAGMIIIGDTKNPGGPVLSYTRDEWITFVQGIRQGDVDDLL